MGCGLRRNSSGDSQWEPSSAAVQLVMAACSWGWGSQPTQWQLLQGWWQPTIGAKSYTQCNFLGQWPAAEWGRGLCGSRAAERPRHTSQVSHMSRRQLRSHRVGHGSSEPQENKGLLKGGPEWGGHTWALKFSWVQNRPLVALSLRWPAHQGQACSFPWGESEWGSKEKRVLKGQTVCAMGGV